jgi:hypothetical protein
MEMWLLMGFFMMGEDIREIKRVYLTEAECREFATIYSRPVREDDRSKVECYKVVIRMAK